MAEPVSKRKTGFVIRIFIALISAKRETLSIG